MFRIVGQALRLRFSDAKMTEAEKKVRAYLAEIGRRGELRAVAN